MASVDLNAVYSCLPADVLMVPVLMVAVDSQGNNGSRHWLWLMFDLLTIMFEI